MTSPQHDPTHAHADVHAPHAGAHSASHDAHAELNPAHYWKIAKLLIVLAVISGLGPEVAGFMSKAGAETLAKGFMLATAFGIAFYKAYLVCVNFMHLHIEKRYVVYLLSTALAFMLLFFAGASPDVRNHRGRNWENTAAQEETARALAAHAAGGHEGHEAHDEVGGCDENPGEPYGCVPSELFALFRRGHVVHRPLGRLWFYLSRLVAC